MKATIERATLLKSLGHVQSVVERRNTIPILSNVLIEAREDGSIRLMATDLDLQVDESVPANVGQPGATTVSAHTLFAQSVRDEPDSYRTHYVLGTWYMEHERKSDAELEFRKGLKLFPYDPYLAFSLAEAYRTSGMCAPALPLYKLAREVDPEFPVGRSQYALCLYDQGQYDEARRMALAAVNAGGLVGRLHNVIRVIDSAQKAQRIGQGGKISMVGIPGSGGKLPDTVQKSTLRPVSNASR